MQSKAEGIGKERFSPAAERVADLFLESGLKGFLLVLRERKAYFQGRIRPGHKSVVFKAPGFDGLHLTDGQCLSDRLL